MKRQRGKIYAMMQDERLVIDTYKSIHDRRQKAQSRLNKMLILALIAVALAFVVWILAVA